MRHTFDFWQQCCLKINNTTNRTFYIFFAINWVLVCKYAAQYITASYIRGFSSHNPFQSSVICYKPYCNEMASSLKGQSLANNKLHMFRNRREIRVWSIQHRLKLLPCINTFPCPSQEAIYVCLKPDNNHLEHNNTNCKI